VTDHCVGAGVELLAVPQRRYRAFRASVRLEVLQHFSVENIPVTHLTEQRVLVDVFAHARRAWISDGVKQLELHRFSAASTRRASMFTWRCWAAYSGAVGEMASSFFFASSRRFLAAAQS